jgi:hypothetical protein
MINNSWHEDYVSCTSQLINLANYLQYLEQRYSLPDQNSFNLYPAPIN